MTTLRCPVCRAENREGPTCRRCRADLSLLFALEDRRRQLLAAACVLAGRGDGEGALAAAAGADALRHDGDSQRALAMGHLLRGDFAEAWRCYQARQQRS